ncbi:ABC transporter permease [Pyrobaculum calidifontis]|uniref:Binding-protein-dependent transport systems inner membrane component n=1 Tax=Pyrobaculum calidifontis (strain DSM 21063 / JCM 11548 / VA1) TaxID=410359 RepID=A3MUT1_PYRCJ|nr:ABC transporter permease [Pyrobaculum calidifontis]ABO08398.1 binding-protein-dependent transport systems inner membrane component [Pyrobaculum calidifontis JCM 11548]
MIREFFRSASGVAGFAIILLFSIIAIYVVATFPLDYGTRYWSNPKYWEEYPKLVPPVWYNYFVPEKLPQHYISELRAPTATEEDVKRWVFSYNFDADKFPTGVILKYANLTFYESLPIISIKVKRPDGQEVVLMDFDSGIPSPRPGESPPYVRFVENPRSIVLSVEPGVVRRAAEFARSQGVNCTVTEVREAVLLPYIIFGIPQSSKCSAESFKPLKGTYIFEVELVGDPRDRVDYVRLIVQGAVYGAMGTDYLGRDLAQGLLFGFPVALFIGGVVAVLATVIGMGLGIVSGYVGGKVDEAIQRFADVMNNLPLLPLLILFVFVLGRSLFNIIFVLVVFGWAGTTIIVRSMVLSIKTSQFVEAAKLAGASSWWIMWKHILPPVLPYSFALMILNIPGAILSEASLSFLGLGDPSIPTWGQIMQQAFDNGALQNFSWWWILPPGILIVITAVGFVLIFFALEPIVNPRLRRQ